MSIEKTASLIGVAIVTILLGVVIFSREERPRELPGKGLRTTERTDEASFDDVAAAAKKRRSGRVSFEDAREGRYSTPPARRAPEPRERPARRAVDLGDGPAASRARAGFRDVKVRKNDNFWTIAKRELGHGGRFQEVAKANPDVDPKRLRPGQTIRVPDADAAPERPSRRRAPHRNERPESSVPAALEREHKVRRNETLSGISKQYYATAAKWSRILEANRATISRPEQLKPGMVLVIP